MGEYNYLENSYYPHHGPSKYSYTSDFGKDNNRDKTAAQAEANTKYFGLATKTGQKAKILLNLQILIDGARQAEMKFLADSGIDLTDGDNAKAIFKNFNLILNSQQLFQRNLDMLKQLSEGVDNKLVDPSKFLHTYILQGINEYVRQTNFNIHKAAAPQLQQILNQIMDYAVEKTYEQFIEVIDNNNNLKFLTNQNQIGNQERNYAMQEMLDTIRKLQGTGLFGKFASAFKIEEKLLEATDPITGKVDRPKITSYTYGQGGTPLELITTVIGTEMAKIHQSTFNGFMGLTIDGEMTGGANYNQQKGDTIIGFARGQINFSNMQKVFEKHKSGKGSTRVQNIEAFAEYLANFTQDIEHLLVISDKNAGITASFEGARAQEKMPLNHVHSMLTLFGVPQVGELIDYLANSGTEMIQGEINSQIRTALMSYVAYFLFDHVELKGTVKTGANVVNIMNISGTYIPLSVYLEGVYKSLAARLNNISRQSSGAANLVEVTVSLKGEPPIGEKWTVGTWQGFRETREKSSSLEYKVMMDIADFITGLMAS